MTASTLVTETWQRYVWLRDNGHLTFVRKADLCEGVFEGPGQWLEKDRQNLNSVGRPALTINKVVGTVSTALGEQIFNRTAISFRAKNGLANGDTADALTKVFMQISDNNQLPWLRSDVFADGLITSRGFLDARLDFEDSLSGEVRITQLNPKNVLIDADADAYDPDTWNDVIVTRWMSADEIEVMYGKKHADELYRATSSGQAYDEDEIDSRRDRFGEPTATGSSEIGGWSRSTRGIRVVERQWRKLALTKHFIDLKTGDTRPVPADWEEEQIKEHLGKNPDLHMTKKRAKRIRWTVIAADTLLHDEWSPYRHFTVIPYFPHFRRGSSMGMVEHLIGPQELLNKTSSQELHVINTTANSGWKVKDGALKNMTIAELEQRGAETGLVLELEDMNDAEKIKPNPIPTGLDRVAQKSENFIDSISGVSKYMKGFSREDVSGKSVEANQQSGQANLAKTRDNLNRTDYLLARMVLSIVQEYYIAPRLIHITTNRNNNETEEMQVNEVGAVGEILRDLTIGEYAITVTNEPERDSFEDNQFDQAMMLRNDAGVAIPDRYLIMASKLRDKTEIATAVEGDPESPEAQLQARAATAEVEGAELENELKRKEIQTAATEPDPQQQAEHDMLLKADQASAELQLKEKVAAGELALKRNQQRADQMATRVDAIHDAPTLQ